MQTEKELTSPRPLDDIGKANQAVDIHRSPRPVQYDSGKKDSMTRTSPRDANGGKGDICGLCGKKPAPPQVDDKQTDTGENDAGGARGRGINCEDHTVPVSDPESIMYPKPNPPMQQPQLAFIPVMTTSPIGGYNGFGSNPNLVYSITNGAFQNSNQGPSMDDNLDDPSQYMYDPQAAYHRNQQQQLQQAYSYGGTPQHGQQLSNNSSGPVIPQSGSSPPANIPHHSGYGVNPGVNPQSGPGGYAGIPHVVHAVSNMAYTAPSPTSYLTMVSAPVSYVQTSPTPDFGAYGNVGYA